MAILSQIAAGSFTADGSPLVLPFAGKPDIVRLYYQGNAAGDEWESVANPGVVKELYWNRNMVAGTGLATKNTNGAATDTKDFIAAGGVSYYDPQYGALGPAITGTAVSQAANAQVTANGHGLATGDIVLLTGTTGMLQIAGMTFQITVTGANTFTLDGLDSSGFAAPATAVVVRKVLFPGIWQPQSCLITAITQAADAVITTSVDHGYVADQLIYLSVAAQFGMSQASGKITKIKSVTANTMTVELDTSGFTAFAFPASNQGPFDFPNLSNYGVDSSLVLNAYRNDAVAGVYLGANVCGTSGDLVHYEIIQADSFVAV